MQMSLFRRNRLRDCTRNLVASDPRWLNSDADSYTRIAKTTSSRGALTVGLSHLINEAGLKVPAFLVIFLSLSLGATTFFGLFPITGPILAFLAATIIASTPFSFLDARAISRANAFAEDYPNVLLAASSSLKVGLTPLAGLERAVMLLPNNSAAKKEVSLLMSRLERGEPKETCLSDFASDIRLPELSLFRQAFTLVLEHGGKFAPTLERLAQVTRDRVQLISSARVSTTSMRLTANVLLFIILPFLIMILSSRYEDYWAQMFGNPTAKTFATVGIAAMLLGVALLRKMSAFKP